MSLFKRLGKRRMPDYEGREKMEIDMQLAKWKQEMLQCLLLSFFVVFYSSAFIITQGRSGRKGE